MAVADHLTENMPRLGDRFGVGHLSLDERVDAAITHYFWAYIERDYLATLNILFGILNDAEFSHKSRLVNIQKGSDGPWLALFADQAIDEKQLLVARNIALSALRGMAIAYHLGIATSFEAELALLKSMLISFFQMQKLPSGAPAPEPPTRGKTNATSRAGRRTRSAALSNVS